MNDVSKELQSLSPAQRALLLRRLKEKKKQETTVSEETAPSFGIQLRADQEAFPLSAGQYRLLAQEELTPGTARYNLTWAYRLQGPLDVSMLSDAVRLVLKRHEVLRSTYVKEGGDWTQYVCSLPDQVLTFEDFSSADGSDALDLAISYAERLQETPFDLQSGLFLRTCVIGLAPEDHLFVVCSHHLVADGWSFGVLLQEISSLYNHALEESQASLPDLPIQYADFAAWQQAWLKSEAAEKQAAQWEERFSHKPEPVVLPSDRITRRLGSTEGARIRVALPSELYDAVARSAEALQRTPYAYLLAAFNALLYRYSGQRALSVCTPVSGPKPNGSGAAHRFL